MSLPVDNILATPVVVWVLVSVMGLALAVIGYLIKYLIGDFKKTLDQVEDALEGITEAIAAVTATQKVMQEQISNEKEDGRSLTQRVNDVESEMRTVSERLTVVETRCDDRHK